MAARERLGIGYAPVLGRVPQDARSRSAVVQRGQVAADHYRGRILADLGRDREAVEAFRRCRLRRGVNF